jgi:hypothetical protein
MPRVQEETEIIQSLLIKKSSYGIAFIEETGHG